MNGKTEIVTIVSKDAFTKKGLLESIKNGLAPDNAISWAAEKYGVKEMDKEKEKIILYHKSLHL